MGEEPRTPAELYTLLGEKFLDTRELYLELARTPPNDVPAQAPPPWFAGAVQAAVQAAVQPAIQAAVQDAIAPRFEQQNRVLRRMMLQQSYNEKVLSARLLNAKAAFEAALVPLPIPPNEPPGTDLDAPLPDFVVPAGFPRSPQDLLTLKSSEINELLDSYLLSKDGNLDTRRRRLLQHIGLMR